LTSSITTFFCAKYSDPLLLHSFCNSILEKYKLSQNFISPVFLKFFIERLLQLGYSDEKFFREMEEVAGKLESILVKVGATKEVEVIQLVREYCKSVYQEEFRAELKIMQ
jgi:hypothetical protein